MNAQLRDVPSAMRDSFASRHGVRIGCVVNQLNGDVFGFTLGAEALLGYELCVIHEHESESAKVLHVSLESLAGNAMPDGHLIIIEEPYQLETYSVLWPSMPETKFEKNLGPMGYAPCRVRQLVRMMPGPEMLLFPGNPGCSKAHAKQQAIGRFFSHAKRLQ